MRRTEGKWEPGRKTTGSNLFSGGLAGSPFKKENGRVAVLGINWGGDAEQHVWDDAVPRESELLTERKPFHLAVRSLFLKSLSGEPEMRDVLSRTFYTNRDLFRTRREKQTGVREKLLWDDGDRASRKAVCRMLSFVQPSLMVCFGSRPGLFVANEMCGHATAVWCDKCEDYWIVRNSSPKRYVFRFGRTKGAFPMGEGDSLMTVPSLPLNAVWCFPHPSNNWTNADWFLNRFGEVSIHRCLSLLVRT